MDTGKNARIPAVAGQFYEADPKKLRADLDKMFSESKKNLSAPRGSYVQAVICPHAGYVYSGATAAATFKTASQFKYKKALIIAPSHHFGFTGLAVSDFTAYLTPLGETPVEFRECENLSKSNPTLIQENTEAHACEHSLEVQLPFLQTLFPEISIIPLICGQIDRKTAECLSEILIKYWNRDTLWVISSDFTHFGYSFDYVPFTKDVQNKLKNLDMGAIKEILKIDYDGFSEYVNKTGATICGNNPIKILLKTALLAAKKGSDIKPELIEYTNSGELTGDYSHCVSYAGIAFHVVE